MRTEIKRILTFGLHNGPVSRSQLFLSICLVSVLTGIVALFCANADHPVICFFLFSYNAAIFVSIVRGRLKTVGEEVSGGCLFGFLVVFSVLIPPLLLYLFFAKEKISQSPSIIAVKETVSSLEENGPTVPMPLPILKRYEEPAGETTTGGTMPIDYSEQFRNFVESVEKPTAPKSVDFQCFICNRRSGESLTHEGRTFRGDGLYGPTNQRKDFTRQNLRRAEMSRGVFDWSTFDRADLSNANLKGSYFFKASFIGACLKGANLEGSDLTGADFQGAHLFGARLANARVGGANFAKADLAWADFSEAEMVHRSPSDESLLGKYPNFEGSNFERARNLDVVKHASERAGEISVDGYFKPSERLTRTRLLELVDSALNLETWVEDSLLPLRIDGSQSRFEQLDIVKHDAFISAKFGLPMRSNQNQSIHFIVVNWRRTKEFVWAERLAAILFTQVPKEVSSNICGEQDQIVALEIVQRMISEAILKEPLEFRPDGIGAEFFNRRVNVFDELRGVRSHFLF